MQVLNREQKRKMLAKKSRIKRGGKQTDFTNGEAAPAKYEKKVKKRKIAKESRKKNR